MSAQLLELLIFAAIAFFVISKLISTLGSTSGDEPTKRGSYFGENTNLKDVTNTTPQPSIIERAFLSSKPTNREPLNGLIVEDNKEAIAKGLAEVLIRLPQFNASNFLRNAKNAFKVIIESGLANKEELSTLVDKRYLEQFKSIVANYGKLISFPNLEATISEIYMFGNNIFIKILFTGRNVSSAIENLKEEWTFTRSLIQSTPDWYLTNIDKPH